MAKQPASAAGPCGSRSCRRASWAQCRPATGGREHGAAGCVCVSSSARTLADGSENARGVAGSRGQGPSSHQSSTWWGSAAFPRAGPVTQGFFLFLFPLPQRPSWLCLSFRAARPTGRASFPQLVCPHLAAQPLRPQPEEHSGSGLSMWLHEPAHATYAHRTSVSSSGKWTHTTSACFRALRSDARWEFSREGRAGEARATTGG